MLLAGMTVRVARDTAHEPDALVYRGQEIPDSSIEVPNPVILIDVLSPSTCHIDASAKLAGYFRVASVQHYLIIDPDQSLAIHHARGEGDIITTRIARAGKLVLDPSGIELSVAEFYPA
jgi:Uma2 family endonuclease